MKEFIWSPALCILAAVCLLQSVRCLLLVINFIVNINTFILEMKILVMFFREIYVCMYLCTIIFVFLTKALLYKYYKTTTKKSKQIEKTQRNI